MWADDFLGLIFPRICSGCGNSLWKHENVLCDTCFYHLPRTNFHLQSDNPVNRIFWGRADILSATSFLLFNKGSKVQNIIHDLKYKGRKDIGIFLGQEFGKILRSCSPYSLSGIIIPVPLHRKKYLKRETKIIIWINTNTILPNIMKNPSQLLFILSIHPFNPVLRISQPIKL